MKKFILSASLIATFMLYVVYARQTNSSLRDGMNPIIQPSMGNSMMSPMHLGQMGMYRDGAYTGKVVDVYFGNIEVEAIVTMGRLVDVKFLQYPNDRKTSIDISAIALPALATEAIKTQSAQVDIVSGATQTSEGFIQSLGDALIKAKV